MEPIKIVMLGSVSCGKTSIFRRYFDQSYSEDTFATVNYDYRMKTITLNENDKFSIVVWDTSGQEKYNSLGKHYYKGTHGFMLVYDVTDRKSFDQIDIWFNAIQDNSFGNYNGMLVANKIDLPERVVSSKEGEKKALDLNFEYFEVSSKKNININESFQYLGELIHQDLIRFKIRHRSSKLNNPNERSSNNQVSCC